jgi:hypothetical protein
MPRPSLVVLGAALILACGGGTSPATFTVDTLSSGALLVRSAAPRWRPGDEWNVTQDLEIVSPEEGDGFFQRVTALAPDAAGGIYLLDGPSSVIQQYDPRGKWIRAIGRKGAGPGEYRGAIGLALRGSRLYVIDQTNIRISVLDTSGTLITSHPRNFANMGDWRWEGGLDTAGAIYDLRGAFTDSGPAWTLARLDSDNFAVTDTFPWPTFQGGATLVKKSNGGTSRTTINLPNMPQLARRYDPRGYLWFGIGSRYQIIQRRLKGDTVRIVERAWTPEPLSDQARARQDSLASSLRKDGYTVPELATSVPAFDALVLDDDGNLWVGPYGRQDAVWHVFDPAGAWLGPVTFPAPILQLSFRDGRYYGLTLDSMDVEHVVRGTVEKRPHISPTLSSR